MPKLGSRQGCWRYITALAFAVCLLFSRSASAELQTTLSMSTPALTPGGQGSFTATQVSGPAGSTTSTLVNPYAGVFQYLLSPGTGRFSSLSGTRYGLFFDTFQIFQSFLVDTYFTFVNSATGCPSATNYTWLLVRPRAKDAPRGAMDPSKTTFYAGGTLAYDPAANPVFSSNKVFDLAGPNLYTSSYNLDNTGLGACSSAVLKVKNAAATPLDQYGKVLFGGTLAAYVGSGGNPQVATLVPQQTLTNGIMTSLGKQVLSGLFTGFNFSNTQTHNNVYVVPDSAGTTFTLKTITNFSDPTQGTTYGTITCTSLNTPMNGFCQGTITLQSVPGSGHSVCQLGSTTSQDVLSCVFQMPSDNSVAGSLIATRSTQSLLSVTLPTTAPVVAPNGTTTVVATLQNLTGSNISTLSDPSTPALQLQPPFSDPGAYTGAGGTCGPTLAGFASCTVNLTYHPTAVGTTQQTFRVQYNNQVTSVNATSSLVGASGLTSITVTPNTGYMPTGTTQQFTATATYSDGSTQDVTNAVQWSSNATSVASISNAGLATLSTVGTFTITANLGGTTGSVTSNTYVVPPNPSGLSATPNSYTQITLNWTSGGGSTSAFQIAYQSGATAPANCSSGTVITSGVVGVATSYAVTGLYPATQYSFRVCAVNSTAGQFSTGVTVSGTTTTPHFIFATSNLYNGNFGSVYFADYACQLEASNAGLSGIWRAVLSDNSVNANAHISLSQSIYNTRPIVSGGVQLVSTSGAFWTPPISNAINYNAGGGSPGSTNVWTGSTSAGAINAGRTCSGWTSSLAATLGEYGTTTVTNAAAYANTTSGCNSTLGLYCINLQSAAATPPNPTSLAAYITGSTSVSFTWSSGGGTTAAYKLAYQTGASAPASCAAGTVVQASTIGVSPTGYTVTGLSASTQYSFRLCAYNSDLSASSTGTTLTVTTTAGGTITNFGTKQVVFSTTNIYPGSFGGIYFGDYICQSEADNAGLLGTWRALLSDDSVAATSHISVGSPIYNNRPQSSGGIQIVAADSTAFWGSSLQYPLQYSGTGSAPGSGTAWTGSTAAGAINTGNTCTSWSTANVAVRGSSGNATSNNEFANANNTCNNSYSLFCTNQQSSAATPANPTGFAWYVVANNYISFTWASGGGTTAAYKIAYQTGGTAPANCSSGTVISSATLGINPTSYSVPGLAAATQYSFRLCAVNSDNTAQSSGQTVTATTQAANQGPAYNLSNKQVVFSTATGYQGSFGGLYFADFACQNEAVTNGLSGTWKAIIGDETTSAVSRISITGNVYNNRPFNSGGIQVVAVDSSSFWGSALAYNLYYNGGGTTPASTNNWTGATAAGAINTGNTCTSWTTASNGVNGQVGVSTTTGNEIANGNNGCNSTRSFYCTNQQSSSAAPPNPATFTWSTSSSNSIGLTWTSGGGTTAGYILAYQATTAPANCSSGTVVTAATLGVNPSSYSVTGLSSSTTYGFRLCAVNSDQTSTSSGITFTQATQSSSSGPISNLGTKQIVFETSSLRQANFGGIYFGDYICQSEALAAGLSGVWKAILSDETTSAFSRITIPGAVYNNRPAASGGYQITASDSSTFWGSSLGYSLQYNASGTSPGSTVAWTGSTAAGATNTGLTCSGWTTASSASQGTYGNNTSGNVIANGNTGCNGTWGLYCINQQTAASAPPDPTGFTWNVAASNYVSLTWASGGGTTAAYVLAYQSGSAPANCSTGTVVPASTLGVNPTGYSVTGLTASTTYGFRLCALNSDLSLSSTGVTFTVATQSGSSAPAVNLGSKQVVFSTSTTTLGNFGGLYYADFICQNEANTNSLGGTWKAILSDDSTSAVSRIAISGGMYNFRPVASGGLQLVASDATSFWSGSLAYPMNYNAAGTSPGSNNDWTGSTVAGAINTGNTCSSWTTSAVGSTGTQGGSTGTGNLIAGGNSTCNNTFSLYCTNQQTAAAAPANPASFAWTITAPTYITFAWTSGGGTTAGYKLAYQTGASAPANCSSGTVVGATTLGVNPTGYSVTGLTASTQYSFRLCAVNSDQSLSSTGLTVTQTTLASGNTPTVNLGSQQVVFISTTGYQGNFGGIYYADFVCQNEATTAGLSGVWKAIIGDETTSAVSRLSVPGAVYNYRPAASGGMQLSAANSTAFWGSANAATYMYTASGAAPSNTVAWTGATAAGAIQTGNTCTNWTSNLAAGLGYYGNNGTGNTFSNGATACNSSRVFYCINQQTASATPADPATFATYSVGANSIGFTFSSGGGTTAGYKLAYQTGTSAPSSCSSGTVVPATTLGLNPNTYVLTGLNSSTIYSFRLCAVNSDQSATSTGRTITTVVTQSSSSAPVVSYGSTQVIFVTSSNYNANFGGLYFGDYICQREAINAGLPGIWKAILSDDSTAASTRLAISSNIYNNRSISAGGIQFLSNSTNFWSTIFPYSLYYTAAGTSPSSNVPWTGSTATGGIKAGATCTSWTTNSALVNGEYGVSSNTNSTTTFDNATTTCNNTGLNLYCINQQTAAATPANPTSFASGTVTSSSIPLTWASGGGTTAAYQLAYQTGGTAPANCNSGTVVAASILGINPTAYTVSGLSSGTQYSFRLCAYNSDLSALSSGVTVTATTTSLSATANQTIFATGTAYRASIGGLYFADYLCQTEAAAGLLSGTWKAVLSDDSTTAASRITLASNIYNNRPAGSGGPQLAATSANFWSGTGHLTFAYSASGGAPATTATWTGSTGAGGISTGNTCSGWTSTSSASNANYGNNNQTTSNNQFAAATTTCSNNLSVYCINQQTAASTPPNPSTFVAYQTSSSSVGLLWTSGGGTTAAFQLAYQSGGSAPANCSAGTVVSAATLGINPSTYTVTGLSANTTYSFRLCAYNSDLSAVSSGGTVTVTTPASGNPTTNNFGSTQFIFSTTGAYTGSFGGLYFGDYICQSDAAAAGLPGTWRAILSDGTTAASSRISLSGNVYNLRPLGSGGGQRVSDSTNFWNNLFYNAVTYTAAGLTPSTTINWTGATSGGGNGANNCTAWTSQLSTVNGQYGQNNTTNSIFGTGATNCSTSRSLYCINQQSAASAPPNPTNFSTYSTSSTSINFIWSSGGGTTAAYQLAYQSGGTAPANCNSGTVVTAATLGVNPTAYAVTGLTASTQYTFRLCAYNSDLSAASSGTTLSVTTTASGTTYSFGSNQFIFSTTNRYQGSFGGVYYGDYICQTEATSAALPGIWKAVLADGTVDASTHIALSGNIYNFRPTSSGGAQVVSDSTNFWNAIGYNAPYYTSLGLTPASTGVWTGANSNGTLSGVNCNNWASNSSLVSGQSGRSNTTGTIVNNTTNTCNNSFHLYCMNQQTASSAPPNPATFTTYSVAATSVGLVWTSGGGTTAAYQISYQTGASAPASCTAGTVVSAATIGINPGTYTVTGLTAGTQYSFRLCAANSDVSAFSSGVTLTATTPASGVSNTLGTTQFVFPTSSTTYGGFGGVYFGDYICQREATAASLPGTWKAVISDGTNGANVRIILTGDVFNFRPAASGGAQKVSDSTNFWTGTNYNTSYYTALGLTPTTAGIWTGSLSDGTVSGTNCGNWTTTSSATSGQSGRSNNISQLINVGTNTCNNSYTLLCINQQGSSAAPPDPASFTAFQVGTNSVGLAWSTGGGSTAAYQISYQTGGTAPASCTTGTVVSPSAMDINPGSYTVTGLSSGTQYSFRLCATNSDNTAFSTGLTYTTTTSSSGTSYPLGSNQFIFATSGTYIGGFGGIYFGDYICQSEASNAGLTGIWKAVLSDSSNAASSHVSLAGNLYNFRPVASGGAQKVSDSTNFFNQFMYNTAYYTPQGLAPLSTATWTGSTSAGISSGNTCNDWTTVANTSSGQFGRNNSTTALLNNGTTGCNGSFPLYCVNQQTASSAPPNPTGLTNYLLGPNSVGLIWTSGGGTTAAYQIAYQTGGTAPANCTSGTVIPASTLGINPSSYTVTGLSASTQYSFRLCAANSDVSSFSSGTTLSTTTLTTGSAVTQSLSGLQLVFATATTYQPFFGGLYFADYICQNEASTSGLSGTWRAILGDESTAASSHITLTGGSLFNTRAATAGGIQQISNGTGFWGGPWVNQANYAAAGGPPGNVRTWTGDTTTGAINTGRTCTNWTTANSAGLGQIAATTVPTSGTSWTVVNCNNSYSLYCINQQSAAATPPDPTSFSAYSVSTTTVGLNWASGGGTTAAYQISYQAGSSAPASCTAGTVVSSSTLGVNPNTYTVIGLTPGTQYSFRICALNSDLSLTSVGSTVTTTTQSVGNTYSLGSAQYIFSTSGTYTGNFGGVYYADYICQAEANTAGLPGTWRAIISDATVPASTHVALSGNLYNTRAGTSGGSQFVTNDSSFFGSATLSNQFNYTASGGAPGSIYGWLGSTAAGAVNGTLQCNGWTSNSSTLTGQLGRNTTTVNYVNNTGTTCNTARGFFCVNQQSAAATPPDPTGFANYLAGSTYLGFNWTSGGGTTAAYQMSYQTGSSAPASCATGTVITPATLGVNPSAYTVTGLSPSTQYSFRLCAYNSDLSSASTGVTLTVTTPASGLSFFPGSMQFIFATAAAYSPNFGSVYWGDRICQNEAATAGLTGTWKALIGDDSTSVASRISLSSPIYNLALSGTGGPQPVSNASSFWNGTLLAGINYTALGGSPANTRVWTGAAAAGALNNTHTCTSWTTNLAASNASTGSNNVTTTAFFNNGNIACNNSYSLYCINQQTPTATPPNPTGFAAGTKTTSSIQFSWTSGGTTTAGFQIAYQLGATAPNDCNSGTVIPASTIGINVSSYTVTGLSSATQYSFRLCAENSDSSQPSAGSTVTATTN